MARASHPTDFSYRPIRARIAASLEDADDTFITDMCMLVAAIAERRHMDYLAALDVSDDRQWLWFLARGQDTYRQEIQAIRDLTATLTAAGLALGLSAAQVRTRIDALICRELFAFPEEQDSAGPRVRLGGHRVDNSLHARWGPVRETLTAKSGSA